MVNLLRLKVVRATGFSILTSQTPLQAAHSIWKMVKSGNKDFAQALFYISNFKPKWICLPKSGYPTHVEYFILKIFCSLMKNFR